jgi:hypothetical protein
MRGLLLIQGHDFTTDNLIDLFEGLTEILKLPIVLLLEVLDKLAHGNVERADDWLIFHALIDEIEDVNYKFRAVQLVGW